MWASPHYFSGSIIDFNVGFSDATAQFATFYERVRLRPTTPEQIADDARRMAYVTEMWRESGEVFIGEYGYTKTDLTETSVALSVLADVWCLAHEAAHRLLGHVDGLPRVVGNELAPLLGDLAEAFEAHGGEELEADTLATFLLRGDDPFEPASQAAFEACVGAHVALTVLQLGDADPEHGSETHPPVGQRLAFNAQVQERLTGGSYTQSVCADVAWAADLVETTIAAATAHETSRDHGRDEQHEEGLSEGN